MNYKDWNNQFENKMTFFEWLAKDQETTEEYAWEFIYDIFQGKVIHAGDCTHLPFSCDLCLLETLLEEYREYYFKGTFRDKKMIKKEYEIFCDTSYFDMWVVRNINDKRFESNMSFHFDKKEDAEKFKELIEKAL